MMMIFDGAEVFVNGETLNIAYRVDLLKYITTIYTGSLRGHDDNQHMV